MQKLWEEKQHLDVLKHYAEDSGIPQSVKDKQWSIFGKALNLTFLKEDDMAMVDIQLELMKIRGYMCKPAHKLSFKDVNESEKIYNYAYLTAKRSIGTKEGVINERTLQNTQILQSLGGNQAQPPRKKWFGLI